MTTNLLEGVRVLDMTNVLAGPFAGYQLALLGADVIKVETAGSGDLARQLGADPDLSAEYMGVSFLAQNAGKRSVTVNLKTEGGKKVFEQLLADADVLLENFRPGVLARLGFDWERLHELNPRLIYCAVSGFGATGPMSSRPAYDQVVQGLSGIMSVTGDTESAPLRVGYPVCDSFGGMAAAMTVCAAIVRQRQTGQGAYLDTSMLDAAITSMGWVVSNHLVTGKEPVPMGNENMTSAPSGAFRTADGVLNIAANKQEQYEILCKVLGREELVTDPRFVTREDRKRNREILRDELEISLKERTAAEWDEILLDTGVPAAPVAPVSEALRSDQIRHRGLISELDVAAGSGTVQVLGLPTHVDGESVRPDTPPPTLGEHTDEILREIGFSAEQITRFREEGAV
ncbi:CaiB/BaiF CoA transferase family protein [Rhodococcus rhodochrous]|uniref:CoA transferase n=1 Tax=Rhodococcus rhodochrous TaxID=1829 RepID=A0AA46WU32_RHORH|nr:CaiB/BaiF CoA-transferase family protein [Rhodococcus rhodochrous]MCB8909392.1 CoA transferase [Rhodococcus rhodochrous]MDJ0400764.1 CaiB/BaiF CoA-transferase family protein [Rhodococcus rhodochrous]MDO1484157.1 CoA transferase [Rhodococcus rhodochrous]TWH41696.1 crotonobetainyl-CoA:carnitine CoA-transferase CaiB-like acyl-CoA transferase [Rhodococcus rhodochrous J38]UZF43739.1 CoA transferase [Rhodococcus rhodochrous]